MCDSAAPGMRTGSARDIVFPSAPWLAAHARACQSSFEQAGAGRTPICAPTRPSLARSARARLSTLVACVHDTALLIASLPGSPIAGMRSPVSRARGSHLPRPAATGASHRTSDQGAELASCRRVILIFPQPPCDYLASEDDSSSLVKLRRRGLTLALVRAPRDHRVPANKALLVQPDRLRPGRQGRCRADPGALKQMENGNPTRAKEVPLSWSDRACRSSRRSRPKGALSE